MYIKFVNQQNILGTFLIYAKFYTKHTFYFCNPSLYYVADSFTCQNLLLYINRFFKTKLDYQLPDTL